MPRRVTRRGATRSRTRSPLAGGTYSPAAYKLGMYTLLLAAPLVPAAPANARGAGVAACPRIRARLHDRDCRSRMDGAPGDQPCWYDMSLKV